MSPLLFLMILGVIYALSAVFALIVSAMDLLGRRRVYLSDVLGNLFISLCPVLNTWMFIAFLGEIIRDVKLWDRK